MEFRALLASGVEALGLPLPSAAVLTALERYAGELLKWGRRINLVARAPLPVIVETHFLDSLTLVPVIEHWPGTAGTGLLDVGSGAGFPGLVVKIVRPDWPLTLVEPREKRAVFLRHLIRTLGLEGVRVLSDRLETDNAFVRRYGRFPWLTCRALFPAPEFLPRAREVTAPGGMVYVMQGPRAEAPPRRPGRS